jgi:hypothetical protein
VYLHAGRGGYAASRIEVCQESFDPPGPCAPGVVEIRLVASLAVWCRTGRWADYGCALAQELLLQIVRECWVDREVDRQIIGL